MAPSLGPVSDGGLPQPRQGYREQLEEMAQVHRGRGAREGKVPAGVEEEGRITGKSKFILNEVFKKIISKLNHSW